VAKIFAIFMTKNWWKFTIHAVYKVFWTVCKLCEGRSSSELAA